MLVCAVNRVPSSPEHTSSGPRTHAHQLALNFDILEMPPTDRPVVYIDDVLRRGWHVAAMDHVLGRPNTCAALVVGVAEGPGSTDSYLPQGRELQYDTTVRPWSVVVRRRQGSSPPPGP
jgi:hypothetical protein